MSELFIHPSRARAGQDITPFSGEMGLCATGHRTFSVGAGTFAGTFSCLGGLNVLLQERPLRCL